MIAFSNLHVLSSKHGEVVVHHFWLLFLLVYVLASRIAGGRSSK